MSCEVTREMAKDLCHTQHATGSSDSSCLRFQGEKNLRTLCQSIKLCCADLLQDMVGREALAGGLQDMVGRGALVGGLQDIVGRGPLFDGLQDMVVKGTLLCGL